MADKGLDATRVKENGWRQGSILDEALVAKLSETGELSEFNLTGLWVVISHDCDITNPSMIAEPTAEVIFGEIVDSNRKSGDKQWGKNPRLLHISDATELDGKRQHLEFGVHNRAFFSRTILATYRPADSTLNRETVDRLVSWIAKRYVRRAFADTFNDRTRKVVNRLRSKMKKGGQLITGIYLLVSDDELEPEQDYELIVWGAMREQDYEIIDKRQAATELLGKIESALDACDGVSVAESEIRSESTISIADVRLMKRWDFDDLTLREEAQDAIPRQE